MKNSSIYIMLIILLCDVGNVNAASISCGSVTINQLLAGPRHGAMIKVNKSDCGRSGWVCLDPNGEHMTIEESKRLFSFVLAHKMANRSFQLTVYDNVFATACNGGYPVVEDIRSN